MQNNEINQLQETVQALGLSNADVARISGKSTGTVSQVMGGKYKGRPEVVGEITEALAAWRKAQEERPEVREVWFTDGQKLIQSVLGLTYATQGFSVVVGPSGIGKTYTARNFNDKHPDVLYLRCADGMCMGDVIDALLDLTGTACYGSNSQRCWNRGCGCCWWTRPTFWSRTAAGRRSSRRFPSSAR